MILGFWSVNHGNSSTFYSFIDWFLMISSRCTKTRHMAIRCNQQLATFAVGIFFWAKLGRSNEYNLAFSRGLWLNSLGQDRALRGEIKGSEPVVTSLNLGIFASWYIVEAWHQTQKWYKDIRRSIIMMIMYLYHFFLIHLTWFTGFLPSETL